jgi:hypothetical protein
MRPGANIYRVRIFSFLALAASPLTANAQINPEPRQLEVGRAERPDPVLIEL